MTDYGELLARLFDARRAGIILGLDRIVAVLARMDHPETRLGVVVHIGGTNGKGSTAAMVAAVARACGRTTALYSSPHLASLRERFVVDGEPASEAALVDAYAAVTAAGGQTLTFFEQITAMALWWFAQHRPDITVLEVGLGGRFDATNVVPAPIAAVTGVALDHQELLGPDVAAIATEKAGIFKPGQRVVIGAAGEPEAVALLRDAAVAGLAAAVRIVTAADVARAPATALLGEHQRANAACADAIVDQLEAIGALRAPADQRGRGYAAVVHPGRLEQVDDRPVVLLDGAHNPHGAAALARHLAARTERPRVLVLAVSADKDVDGMIAALGPAVELVVATRYSQPRALAPPDLAARVRAGGIAAVERDDLSQAIDAARAHAGSAGLVAVAGSLYAVGEARPRFRPMPIDPWQVSDPAPRPASGG